MGVKLSLSHWERNVGWRYLRIGYWGEYVGTNILITLYANTLSLFSSLSVRDQVSYPYKKKRGKIIVLFFLIFKFLDSKPEDKRSLTEYLNCSTLSESMLFNSMSWFCPAMCFARNAPKYHDTFPIPAGNATWQYCGTVLGRDSSALSL